MPELPEIANLAGQMTKELKGKEVVGVEIIQPKCLNLPPESFEKAILRARFEEVTYRGKWLVSKLTKGWFLLNLGMGGEVLLVTRETLPENRRLILDFSDGKCLSINFWWFGYAHWADKDELAGHKETAKLGPNADRISLDEFIEIVSGKRSRIKNILLDQSRIAGIGNVYIQDILFKAGLHPLRLANTLDDAGIEKLHKAVLDRLNLSKDKGGLIYEVDLLGRKGGFSDEDYLVGYREEKPCPVCGTTIAKIKTGSTSSYICPKCQPLVQ